MRKIITLAFFLLIVLNVYAITEKEKKEMETYLDNVKDDREKFEIFLAFADAKNINLEEAGLKKKVEDKAKQFGILLFPYQGIAGIEPAKADAKTLTSLGETRIEQELAIAAKKMSLDKISSFWPIFFILVSFLIVFFVLEFYKRERMKMGEEKEMNKKKKKKIKKKKKKNHKLFKLILLRLNKVVVIIKLLKINLKKKKKNHKKKRFINNCPFK